MKSRLIDPSFLNLLIPISIATHYLFPIRILIHPPLKFLGIVIILLGLILNLVASQFMRRNQTPVGFHQPPIRLVTDGPFQFNRNPIYLSGLIVLLGIAILLGSLASFIFPVLLFLLLDLIYIPAEEREMEEKFGSEYIEYKQTVRRWV